jgi:hypothetical protein
MAHPIERQYRCIVAQSADELEDKVNALLEEWPYWEFIGSVAVVAQRARPGNAFYREMLKQPDPQKTMAELLFAGAGAGVGLN